MDTVENITTKLDVKEFASKRVPADVIMRILDAARLTGSAMNLQHWRLVLVRDKANLKKVANDSTTGGWVAGADFAVIILTDPKVGPYLIDTGRVLQDMQLAAWNFGVASRIFTGIKEEELRRDFGIPTDLKPTAVLGFGYPARKITGKKKKNRKALEEIAFSEAYGRPFDPKSL